MTLTNIPTDGYGLAFGYRPPIPTSGYGAGLTLPTTFWDRNPVSFSIGSLAQITPAGVGNAGSLVGGSPMRLSSPARVGTSRSPIGVTSSGPGNTPQPASATPDPPGSIEDPAESTRLVPDGPTWSE
jgi:hypothetical protein